MKDINGPNVPAEPTRVRGPKYCRKRLRHQGPRVGAGGTNNGFGSHTCGGLFAFGNKERNDKRKARARLRRLAAPRSGSRPGVRPGMGNGGVRVQLFSGRRSLREQWRNNVQIVVSDAPRAAQVRCHRASAHHRLDTILSFT
ncbi:hypothetical protein EVAR_103086_1 [Eumeta japonica]|uniref:Uncharacterized protein n=1 Tax=Eumeta variegata TaxID=151549 RepID=A0A4C1WMZ4_EUMVA|nr:hypothetical protein EVAR_103086_1 [Eumeta japonica]